MAHLRNPLVTPLSAAPRGRPFANGNPGRKPGSKNRTTAVATALLDGEAEELVRKAVDLAKAGDVPMLKFLLSRILPRERPVKLDLPPMNFADDAVVALGATGEIGRANLELRLNNTEPQPSSLGPMGNPTTSLERKGLETSGVAPVERVEKSGPARPEPRRVRDREHVKFVPAHPCLICGRRPADPHHLRFAQSRALGRKVSDEFTVPLCRGHHREIHRYGDEAAWWAKVGIEPLGVANTLWRETHPLT